MTTLDLPQFSNISLDTFKTELQKLLQDNLDYLNTQNLDNPIKIQEKIDDHLQKFWSPVAHLHAVKSTPELRHLYSACLPLLSDYETAVSHHEKLYQAISHYHPKNILEKRIIELELRDFKLAGISLSPEKKARYGEIEKTLSELSTKFSENILDATQSWHYQASEEELRGIPAHLIPNDKKLSLDYPCYSAVMRYAEDRSLREKCYYAYVTRASELQNSHYNNTDIMQNILTLRQELSELLGFKNYAELSLATKMAKSPEEVLNFLNQLVEHAKPVAQKELEELTQFAGFTLSPWDIAFYTERLSQERYHIHQELFRPYFPAEHVLSGLFSLVSDLYGISIEKYQPSDTWAENIQCYKIYSIEKEKKLLGIFYTDLYTRELKREGAWMDDYCSRLLREDGTLQVPVAYLTCNFMPPQNDMPGLLTHDDVITLFHEFGHCLHHLLTRINYRRIAGIHGVPWDAVELPSQFMENFCWQKSILKMISTHYKTHEPLPDELIDKLISSRHFQAALQLLRQLEFGLFDFHLHLENFSSSGTVSVMDIFHHIHEKIAVIKTPDYTRFPHTFSHIFSGGYAAAYYSYLWAEVLSCDVFSLFEENGIIDAKTGHKFLATLLSQGGSQPPDILFQHFRGRPPNQTAFLNSWGLLK